MRGPSSSTASTVSSTATPMNSPSLPALDLGRAAELPAPVVHDAVGREARTEGLPCRRQLAASTSVRTGTAEVRRSSSSSALRAAGSLRRRFTRRACALCNVIVAPSQGQEPQARAKGMAIGDTEDDLGLAADAKAHASPARPTRAPGAKSAARRISSTPRGTPRVAQMHRRHGDESSPAAAIQRYQGPRTRGWSGSSSAVTTPPTTGFEGLEALPGRGQHRECTQLQRRRARQRWLQRRVTGDLERRPVPTWWPAENFGAQRDPDRSGTCAPPASAVNACLNRRGRPRKRRPVEEQELHWDSWLRGRRAEGQPGRRRDIFS